MSELRGRLACPRCEGSFTYAVLEDWTTYVSVVCQRCGYKFGELAQPPVVAVVTSPEVPEIPAEVREVARELGLSSRRPAAPEGAPSWNCVSYPDGGMHYVPAERCLWCGKSRQEIRAQFSKAVGQCPPCPALPGLECVVDHQRSPDDAGHYAQGRSW